MPKLSARERHQRARARAARGASKSHKVVVVGHGNSSRALLRAPFDLRSKLGKAYTATVAALRAHVGDDITAPQAALIDQAARLRLLTQVAWSELQRTGAFNRGELVPAYDAFRRAAADERAVLALLGIDRRTAKLPTLQEYLKRQPKGGTDGQAEGASNAAAD